MEFSRRDTPADPRDEVPDPHSFGVNLILTESPEERLEIAVTEGAPAVISFFWGDGTANGGRQAWRSKGPAFHRKC